MNCPRCGTKLRGVALDPDTGWCINHGDVHIGMVLDKPVEPEKFPKLPRQPVQHKRQPHALKGLFGREKKDD